MLQHSILTEKQDVDSFTKALSRGKLQFHSFRIGVVNNPFLIERESSKMERNSQFDFSLIKLRKYEFPHQQTTWMQLNCVTWLVSPSLLSKFELEELEFS